MSATVAAFPYTDLAIDAVPTCPVCGVANPSVPDVDRYGFAIGRSDCPCGFGYLNPRMDGAGYAQFYDGSYRELLQVHGFDTKTLAQQRIFQVARGESLGYALARYVTEPIASLLDVGGSTGGVAEGLARVLPVARVTVLDPCPEELAVAAARGYQTVCATADDAPAMAPQTAILCVQTLDHVRHPLAVLRWLRAHLVAGGWAYFDVVDVVRRAAKMGEPYHRKIDHPLYWTEATFKRALTETGWRVRAAWRTGPYRAHYGVWCSGD